MENKRKRTKIFESDFSNRLKIVYQGDKKLLNTANVNYSYGTLVEVLEQGLNRIPVSNSSSVLLLGMGAGSIIQSLREKYDCHAPVTAVEIDPMVILLARDKFNIHRFKKLKIHHADAWEYVKSSVEQFDLIIVDIFKDIKIPQKFYSSEFWSMLEKNVAPNGFILFNAGIDLSEETVSDFASQLPESFVYQKIFNVLQTNTLIIMQRVF